MKHFPLLLGLNYARFSVALLIVTGCACADSIRLKNGSVINGKIISESASSIQIEPQGTAHGNIFEVEIIRIASLTKTVNGQTVLRGFVQPPLQRASQSVTNAPVLASISAPVQGSMFVDTFEYAGRLIDLGHIEQAIQVVSALYFSTNTTIADLQKLQSLQEGCFCRWLSTLSNRWRSATGKIENLQMRIANVAAQDHGGGAVVMGSTPYHWDGHGHIVYEKYPYYTSAPTVPIGRTSDKMAAESVVRGAQQELEIEQQNCIVLQGKLQTLSDFHNKCVSWVADALGVMLARQAEVLRVAAIAKPPDSSRSSQSEQTWFDRHGTWVFIGVGVILIGGFLGAFKPSN